MYPGRKMHCVRGSVQLAQMWWKVNACIGRHNASMSLSLLGKVQVSNSIGAGQATTAQPKAVVG